MMSTLKEKLSEKLDGLVTAAELIVEEDEEMVKDKGNIIPMNPESKKLELVPSFAVSMDEIKARIEMLQQFVKTYMIAGEDYGLIPGAKKPSLFKPGAEKLCDIFAFAKHAQVVNRVELWDKPFVHYEVKVTLINKRTGQIEAEGLGSANSHEKKFRSQDTFSIANSILKMSKKRAMIDAVLSATRSSGLFSQDLEDIEVQGNNQPRSTTTESISQDNLTPASDEQLQEIYSLAQEIGLTPRVAKQLIKANYKVEDSRQLSFEQAKDFIHKLSKMKNGGK